MKKSICQRRIHLPTAIATVIAIGQACNASPVEWPVERLFATPKVFAAEEYATNDMSVAFLEGLPWKGKATRIFCYYGIPEHSGKEKVPAMVLVHGGGGSAFYRWVKFWNSRGYAAISMDTCGAISGNTHGDEQFGHLRHQYGGPAGWGGFGETAFPVEDQWLYHAVADTIIAHSFLRSLEGVDAKHIGITGVSWGAVISLIAASIDERLSFCAPVYGCGGFLRNSPAWREELDKIGPMNARRWEELWDPLHYLGKIKMPVHWLAGTNDRNFSLPALMASYQTVKNEKSISIRPRLNHAHGAVSEEAIDVTTWADFHLRNIPLPAAERAELLHTLDNTDDWTERKWEVTPANLDGDIAIASGIPSGAAAAFCNFHHSTGFVLTKPIPVEKSINNENNRKEK